MEMTPLHQEVRELAIGNFKRINRTRRVERKRWDLPVGSWDVSVVRGPVLEKAAVTQIILNTKHPVTGEATRFNVFQVMVYPASPKIPILLINVENRVGKEDIFAGFLDVAPVSAAAAELRLLQNRIGKITRDHGLNYKMLRSKLRNLYYMDTWNKQLNAGIGIRLELKSEEYALLRDGTLGWIESYFEIADRRKKDRFTARHESIMYNVRARIMEFYLLKDLSFSVAQKLGVPLEALSFGNFAPCIRY
jgi:coproporphyrinogen III oxidase